LNNLVPTKSHEVHHIDSKQLGIFGEKIARQYLKKKGYQLLDKNYFFKIPGSPQKGEIDIIAKKGELISFVEKKTETTNTREPSSGTLPEEKVNLEKAKSQRKLLKVGR